ncbi:MAG: 16S rRNA (uracil(1498)-N(3))-methyltransferase [Alphaproteobacteria bacterium]|nr:16S rRNA (uracil(1498)-N(3))-methyltransferase [Alphaproteobacteria bacterium]
MQNLPRIFIDQPLETGKQIPISKDQLHYLAKVMRMDKCLVFNNGKEFQAELVSGSRLSILGLTEHKEPSNNLTFAFAPIKQSRMEEMLNAATQMGVARLQPVITERTIERFPKWERIKKIIIEASEQSGRNSVPELLPPIKFSDLEKSGLVFADERFVHNSGYKSPTINKPSTVFVGPEGGFSDKEFAELDKSSAVGISLGKTILRAEVATIAILAKIIN